MRALTIEQAARASHRGKRFAYINVLACHEEFVVFLHEDAEAEWYRLCGSKVRLPNGELREVVEVRFPAAFKPLRA